MDKFNTIKPIGSIYENSFVEEEIKPNDRLVHFVAYCLNPNHFHFILKQAHEKGIETFMQRMGGYTKYFNTKYKRSGALFQGVFKAKHINDNDYLLHLSAYVNFNYLVHGLGSEASKSSWDMITSGNTYPNSLKPDIFLDQFQSLNEYKKFALEAVQDTIEMRKADETFDALFFNEND